MTDPISIPERIDALHERHTRGFANSSDEAWGRAPICLGCGHAWPCDTADLAALVGAEISHRINPVIGWLRLANADRPGLEPDHTLDTAVVRLTDAVNFFRVDDGSAVL